jgi:ribosomal protein S18 acetylase RimI-like enzyme
MGCQSSNCSSRMCASSLRGWTPCGRLRGVVMFDDYAEVKRMYTRPTARGRGIGKALLRRSEGETRAAGKFVLRLETGIRQQEAIGLYERMGFRQRGPFGPYFDNACPQHRDESLFRKGARVGGMIRPERPTTG